MAYTKSQNRVEERPNYVDQEINLVYKDFALAVENKASFLEHGIGDIESVMEEPIDLSENM
jgi:hypothetical protein